MKKKKQMLCQKINAEEFISILKQLLYKIIFF